MLTSRPSRSALAACALLALAAQACTTTRAVTALRDATAQPASLTYTASPIIRGQAPDEDFRAVPPKAGSVKLGGVRPTAATAPRQATAALPAGLKLEVCPPDARVATGCPDPAVCPPGLGFGLTVTDCYSLECRKLYPDEYLCDGGDRGLPVHYETSGRRGLETEDTIAEYTDHRGKDTMRPSSRVCIYAPRFSTVRSVSVPSVGAAVSELADVSGARGGSSMRTHLRIDQSSQQTQPGDVRMRSRVSGLEMRSGQANVGQVTRLAAHEKLINAFQDRGFLRTGQMDLTDIAHIQEQVNSAIIWNKDQYPIIAAKVEVPLEGTHSVHAAAIVVVDDRKSDEPGELRVVKMADRRQAVVGDIITFAIRFDNVGQNPVSDVRIIDNLTPRLKYVEDSATCDLAGRLIVDPNGQGGEMLIWELDQPLASKAGGVVTFKAVVR